jgi:hypothetical protein
VFGLAEGERLAGYFPVDDAHPRRAMAQLPLIRHCRHCPGTESGSGAAVP